MEELGDPRELGEFRKLEGGSLTVNLGAAELNTQTKTCATFSHIPATFGLHQRCYHCVAFCPSFLNYGLYHHSYRHVTCSSPTRATLGRYQNCYHRDLWLTPTLLLSCDIHSQPFDLWPIPILLPMCGLPLPIPTTLSLYKFRYHHVTCPYVKMQPRGDLGVRDSFVGFISLEIFFISSGSKLSSGSRLSSES